MNGMLAVRLLPQGFGCERHDCMKRAVPHDNASPEKDETLADSVYRRLKSDILWGRLEPGQALRSDTIKTSYDVGISPLREALTRLASEALVVRVAQRGFKVAPLDSAQVIDTAEARVLVEGEALRLSIERGDLQWETEIVAASHALSRTLSDGKLRPESEAWAVPHQRFHMALIAACRSEWLIRVATVLFDHAERHRIIGERWRVSLEASGAIAGRNRELEHEKLGKAVLKRDVDTALDLMRRHYMLTAQSVVHVLDGERGHAVRLQSLRQGATRPRRAAG